MELLVKQGRQWRVKNLEGQLRSLPVCLQHLGSEPRVCNLTFSPLPPLPGSWTKGRTFHGTNILLIKGTDPACISDLS